jgi:hypothetical protein
VGVALAESLHPDVRIKWPNDLWLHERKLAGILIETAGTGALRPRALWWWAWASTSRRGRPRACPRPRPGCRSCGRMWTLPRPWAPVALPLVQACSAFEAQWLQRFSVGRFAGA